MNGHVTFGVSAHEPEHGRAGGLGGGGGPGCGGPGGGGGGDGDGAAPALAYETHASFGTVVALPSLNVCHLHGFAALHAPGALQLAPALIPKEKHCGSALQLASAAARQPGRPLPQLMKVICGAQLGATVPTQRFGMAV